MVFTIKKKGFPVNCPVNQRLDIRMIISWQFLKGKPILAHSHVGLSITRGAIIHGT